ncbi:hypothetical protein GF362_02465 [Candidatus Dojkabacteria bacterium]|nr:hypothetical protein [Candidatus Dojkabacteria bacterium]
MKLQDFIIPTKRNKFRAYLLKAETIGLITLLVFVFNIFISSLPISETQAQIDMTSVVYLHNRERAKQDLSQLTVNSKLVASANKKAQLMLEHDCWDHYCPPGMSPWDLFNESHYEYLYAGENLAEGFVDNSVMMKAWMNSPTHKENVLKKEFSEIGIGYIRGDFQGKKDNIVVAVHFGHPFEELLIPVKEDTKNQTNIELIKHIKIIKPKYDEFISNPFVTIQGEVDPAIEKVQFRYKDNSIGIVDTIKDKFIFNNFHTIKFPDGIHTVYVLGLDSEQNLIDESNKIRFTVDTLAPRLQEEDIQVIEIEKGDRSTINIEVKTDLDVIKTELRIGDQVFPGHRLEGGRSRFNVVFDELQDNTDLVFVLEDRAGNLTKKQISTEQILGQASKILEEVENQEVSSSISLIDRLRVIPSEVKFDVKIFNTKNIFNLIVIIVFIALLLIDYLVIKRLDIYTYRHGHHHIKIALLIAIGVISLLSGGIGHILTGINV